jgi:hypothetical protein
MADLKPIGSEKLEGQDKLRRIMEIARFNEALPELVNETAKSQYSRSLADGNNYEIVKERQGYIIKKTISESETDYIEPMKNRKYYNSYSQALKRLNLLAGELNRVNENEEEVSLYGEQKKFVLKTPKPEPEVPSAPGGEEVDAEVDVDAEEPSEDKVTFKTIQKLTGKLTQKIRVLDNEEGMTSENIKYVINMVLSSLNLGELTEEDKEDIMSKFEGESEDLGADDMGGEDMTDDTEVEDIQADMDVDIDQTQPEMGEGHGAIFDSIFKESKVDKVISKYFEVSKKEILENKERKANKQQLIRESVKLKMKDVVKMTETFEQELAAKKFLEENYSFQFIGITNKKNLVFENKTKQVKISPEGLVI